MLAALPLLAFKQARSQASKDTLLSLYFPTGVYKLDSQQTKQLAWLTDTTIAIKQITGYADHRGSTTFNLQLSQRRAEAVASALATYAPRLTAITAFKGEAEAPYAELWKNRRVDIVASIPLPAPVTSTHIQSLELDNIYFIPDSAVVAPQSLPLIRDLAQTLQNYTNEHFEIIGHANCQYNEDPSRIKNFYRLSEQRAKLIYQLLLQHGIPAEKMSYKGVANTQPAIEAPQNVAEKKLNMRVQILITKGD